MRQTRSRMLRLFGIITVAALMSACGASTPAPATSGGQAPASGSSGAAAPATTGGAQQPQAAAKVKRGGTLRINATNSFAGADPAMGQNAWKMWNIIGTYMLRREPDTWKLVGDAIEKWEFSADGKELTLSVRKGMKWENKPPINGRELEAKDVVYSLRSITGLQYPDLPAVRFPRKSNLEDMEDAVAADKYTVKVKMKNPSSTFLDGLAEYRSPIIPDQIREAFGGREALASPSPERYFSAGPFVVTRYQDMVENTYARYPDYWEKGEDGQTKPYVDTIRETYIVDPGTYIAAFVAGQLDFQGITNPSDRQTIAGSGRKFQIESYSPESCWYRMAFNMTRKPFDDIRVRQAIALTLDQKETGQTLFGDFEGKQLWRYSGPLAWAYPEAIPQEELAKIPYYESPKSPATIERAKKLMADAGMADGFSFEMIASTSMKDHQQLALSQINKVFPNIKIKASPIDTALNNERAAKGDFDVQYYCYIHEPTPVAMLKTTYHSKGGRNMARLNDAKMDDLLDKAGLELDKTKRDALLRQAQDRAIELASIVPTTHYSPLMYMQPNVRGIRLGGATYGPGMFAKEIWLDQ